MQLLRLRYLQLKRDLGFWIFIIVAAALYFFHEVASVSSLHAIALTAAVLVFLYGYHLNRKDRGFIDRYLEQPRRQILLNYNLLFLPLSIALVVTGYWLPALVLHGLVSLISQLRVATNGPKLLFISRFVPAEHFEWVSGLRKNFYVIALLLLPALILSPVKLFGLVPLFLINGLFLGFYAFSEPLLMFNPRHLDPATFLNRKIGFFTKALLLTNGPLLLVNAVFNMDSAWFNLCFLFAFLLLAACTVYIKYAHYKPNETQGLSIDLLILFASVLLPYLLPLAILLYYSNRKKALVNLSHYIQ